MNEQRAPKNIKINWYLLIILITSAFAVGVFVGRNTRLFGFETIGRADLSSQQDQDDFRFIRPSLQQDRSEEAGRNRELKPFRYKINSLIEEKFESADIKSISVYFRDLDNGNHLHQALQS